MDVHGLPSPPTSSTSPAPTTSGIARGGETLPVPRVHPLRPGSQKEIALINYLDDKILRITRRYAKKFSNEPSDADDASGYTNYDEVVADIDSLVDVVWISGTPSIQVPYLLSLAGLLCSYLPAFPFSTAVFHVTGKLDQAFATLLSPSHDQSPDTRADNHRVSVTEKVRIKSLIEETRVMAVQTASRSGHAASVLDLSMDEDSEDVEDESEQDLRHEHDTGETAQSLSISLGLARIYKRSLEILGDSLGGALSPAQERLGTHTEPESGTPVAEG